MGGGGGGDPALEEEGRSLAKRYPKKVAVRVGYDEGGRRDEGREGGRDGWRMRGGREGWVKDEGGREGGKGCVREGEYLI